MAGDDSHLGDILITADQLRDRVAELGREISDAYGDREVLLVGVLKGAFVFMADLARTIETISVVWGTADLPGRTAATAAWYCDLMGTLGARSTRVA